MKIIDISHVLDNDTPVFPGDPGTCITMPKTYKKDKYNGCFISSGFHTGTHVDMPIHLLPAGKMASEYSPDLFCGRGVLLDVENENPIAFKAEYRDIDFKGAIVLLHTGYSRLYSSPEYFSAHPYVSGELAEFLLSSGIKMLGMDMPAPDYPPYKFHRDLLRKNIFVLENLTNLAALKGIPHFEVFAFPLKIAAEASFVRAICRSI